MERRVLQLSCVENTDDWVTFSISLYVLQVYVCKNINKTPEWNRAKREEQQPLEHPGKDIYSEQNKKDTNLLGKHSRFARCEICICTNWEHIVDHLGRAGKLIIGFSIESIVFCDRKIERSIGSWKRSNHSQDRSREIFFKDWRDQFDHGRSSLNIGKIVRSKDQIPNPANWYYDHGWAFWSSVFQSNWSFFVTERSIWSGKISNHCRRSFLKINGINLFTVDLFKRSTGSIPSRSIY